MTATALTLCLPYPSSSESIAPEPAQDDENACREAQQHLRQEASPSSPPFAIYTRQGVHAAARSCFSTTHFQATGHFIDADSFSMPLRPGQQVTMSDIVTAMHDKDVVLLGETHDDAIAHRLQLQCLQETHSCMSRSRSAPLCCMHGVAPLLEATRMKHTSFARCQAGPACGTIAGDV